MDEEVKTEIVTQIKQFFKTGGFTAIKRTDIPTDANQVMPKRYGDRTYAPLTYFTGSVLNVANGGTGVTSISNLDIPSNVYTPTAGETITAGQPLMTATGTFGVLAAQQTGFGAGNFIAYSDHWNAQTFLTTSLAKKIKSIDVYLGQYFSPAGNLTFSIQALTAGKPDGTDLGLISVSASTITTDAFVSYTFATPITVSPNTSYAIVMKVPSGNVNNAVKWFLEANAYSDGTAYITTDSGVNWTNQTPNDFAFKITEIQTVAGYVYKTNATSNDEYANNFTGFAKESKSSVESIRVDVSGVNTNQSSLISGLTYYLSSVAGTISSVAGTQSRKIGLAVDTTKILIKHDNP